MVNSQKLANSPIFKTESKTLRLVLQGRHYSDPELSRYCEGLWLRVIRPRVSASDSLQISFHHSSDRSRSQRQPSHCHPVTSKCWDNSPAETRGRHLCIRNQEKRGDHRLYILTSICTLVQCTFTGYRHETSSSIQCKMRDIKLC